MSAKTDVSSQTSKDRLALITSAIMGLCSVVKIVHDGEKRKSFLWYEHKSHLSKIPGWKILSPHLMGGRDKEYLLEL